MYCSSDLHESAHKVGCVHGTVDWKLHNLATAQLSKQVDQRGLAAACRTNLEKTKVQIGTVVVRGGQFHMTDQHVTPSGGTALTHAVLTKMVIQFIPTQVSMLSK